ncbi:hypothetical protein C4561_01260 [candidate division WWE3 bacterium]|jgi:hypothetical protein|uniref:YbjN domain-containing protein n=1 Tax=candidate division WWE3 bacterium TaxID=2053526 RepID=A0A3A4ZLX8_UNCKA|nr:MAG: hypothetical protein C4561_01260 [candidate division WWE3 bacterium]
MDENKIPSISDLEQFLQEYGWTFKKLNPNGDKEVLVAPFNFDDQKGIYISFRIEGEFVMVSTVDFMMNVPETDISKLFALNDRLKLVKLYPVTENPLAVELGFELWADAINKDTFFAFMDMLCLSIEAIMEKLEKNELTFDTKWVTLVK